MYIEFQQTQIVLIYHNTLWYYIGHNNKNLISAD